MDLDWSTHFPEKGQECCQLRPLDGALDLKFCLQQAIHPMQRPHFLIIIQLHHRPTACSLVPSVSQQGAISGHMAPETFDLRTPALVLFGLPNLHREISSVPLAFTERVHNNTSLPLPFFLRRSRILLPLSEGLRNLRLISCRSGQWCSLCLSLLSSNWHA